MACSENEVKDYLQRHNIKQVMEVSPEWPSSCRRYGIPGNASSRLLCTLSSFCRLEQSLSISALQTLSSLLLSHRPDQPWRFLSNSLSYAIQAEQSLPSSKKGQVTFNDLLQQSVPLPPTHHGDGKANTCISYRGCLPKGIMQAVSVLSL